MALLKYIRLYLMIESQYIKTRMQYRVDLLISSIGIFFNSIVTLGVFWVLFKNIPSLAGWSFMEMVFIYGFYLIAISPTQIFFDHIWQLNFKLQDGSFIKYYLRPLNSMFYYMSEMFDLKGLMQVLMGIVLLFYASMQMDLVWSVSKFIFLVLSLFGASLVLISIIIMAVSTSFWFLGPSFALQFAWRLREFSPYPLDIYAPFFRLIFTVILPIGFIAFYPSLLFLRPDQISPWLYFSPIVGLGLFAVAYRIWSLGVNNYVVTGS